VPAAAVIRRVQALSGITGFKGCVGGCDKSVVKFPGLTHGIAIDTVDLNQVEVGGMWHVAVKCLDMP
jgi:hypothetical protein